MIGEYRVSSLVEYCGPTHVPEAFLPDYQASAVEPHREWLVPNHWFPAINRFVIAIQIWIVQAGSNVILIDTGVGNRKPRAVERMNMLNTLVPQWMEAAGAPRDKVTHVVMTHLHSDHVGWNTVLEDGRWVPTFPNARYLMPKENFDYWKDVIDRGGKAPDGGSFADSVLPVVQAGMVDFIDTQKEIAGCLAVEPLPGHTPGHLNFRLRSRGEEGVFAGDVMHHPIQIVCPTWNSAFCISPDVARRSRAAFLADAARTGALFMPCHFGVPHCGYGRKQGEGYRFEPATW
jgi:glyoxylase-like metal-dependent hydrolase (beta-lactamase superfamily II)